MATPQKTKAGSATTSKRSNVLSRPTDMAVTVAESSTAKKNLDLFHKLDFEAWNGRDWDLFKQLHSDDVHVSGYGATTDGGPDHLAWGKGLVSQMPNAKVAAHVVRIGAGDWTAVLQVLKDGSTGATIARWENGRIAEEYLLSLAPGTPAKK